MTYWLEISRKSNTSDRGKDRKVQSHKIIIYYKRPTGLWMSPIIHPLAANVKYFFKKLKRTRNSSKVLDSRANLL